MSFNKRVFVTVCLMITGLATAAAGFVLAANRQAARAPEWQESLIRIHVIANSDTENDQALKRAVRDAVMTAMAPVLQAAETQEETAAAIRSHLGDMEQVAAEVIHSWGVSYPVRAEFGRFSFTDRYMGDLLLPAGDYTALRIVIGEGAGQNWWSIMFPPVGFYGWTSELYLEMPDGTRVKPLYLDEELVNRMEVRVRCRTCEAVKAWWNN